MAEVLQMVFLLLFVFAGTSFSSSGEHSKWMAKERVFEMWKDRFKKTYRDDDEEHNRFLVWAENFKEV